MDRAIAQIDDRFRVFLNSKLAEARCQNPSYSLRAFSKKLGVQPSALSEILNGKRSPTKKFIQKIVDKLMLSPKERSEIFSFTTSDSKISNSDQFSELTPDEFNMISEWYHFGILSLMETTNFKSDENWIAKRLGLNLRTVRSALARLEKIGAIHRSKNGTLTLSGKAYHTTDAVSDIAVLRSHFGDLELERKSLEDNDFATRDFTGLTLSIDPEDLALAVSMIRKFRINFMNKLESNPKKKEVYKLCVRFFPVSKEIQT